MQGNGKCCAGCKIAGLLVVVGAINWGLVGIFQFNLVGTLLGDMTIASRVVYGLVGVAGGIKMIRCFTGWPARCKKKQNRT